MSLEDAFLLFDGIREETPYCCGLPVIQNSQEGKSRIYCHQCGRFIEQRVDGQWKIGSSGIKPMKLVKAMQLYNLEQRDKAAGATVIKRELDT